MRGSSGEADLAAIDLNAWRSWLAWLPQDPVLFRGTVASNIRLGWPGAPPGEVAAAAAAVAGLATRAGRRRLGFARLHDAQVRLMRHELADEICGIRVRPMDNRERSPNNSNGPLLLWRT